MTRDGLGDVRLRPGRGRRSANCRPAVEQLEERLAPATTGGADPNSLVLLPPAELSSLQQMAAANTPEWQAFVAPLNRNLNVVIGPGAYEGSELSWVANYALGYQALKTINPTTAAAYADKAIAVLKSGLDDLQKGGYTAMQYLATGNGLTTTYTLPNNNVVASSVQVFEAPVVSQAVVRGTGPTDPVGWNDTYLSVSSLPGGPATYAQGTSWVHDPNVANNLISWLPGAPQPAAGTPYYVNYASPQQAKAVGFRLNGNQITLNSAPTPGQVIYVQYVYGTPSADGSTLGYQQSSAGDGGFNSILIDSSYTARYLKYVGIGLSWLAGFPGLSPQLSQQAQSLLVQWSNYLETPGKAYQATSALSNYGAGDYAFEVTAALALNQLGNPAAGSLVNQAVAWRQNNLLPMLTNPGDSLAGGFWPEGWSYGSAGIEDLLQGSLALQESGAVASIAPEQAWTSQVIDELLQTQYSQNRVYDGGDWYTNPAPLPGGSSLHQGFFQILSAVAGSPAEQAYANYVLQNYSGEVSNDWRTLLFDNPSAPASTWTASLPLQNFATGSNLLTARSDWGPTATWLAVQMADIIKAGHQTYSPGMMEINRGPDQLLINGNALGGYQGVQKSTWDNTLVVDDGGAGYQTYRYAMGPWYGPGDIKINAYQATPAFTYLYGNLTAAYSNKSAPGQGGSVSNLTRQVVYLNPNYVVVFDNVTTVQPQFTKQLRWSLPGAPTLTGANSWVEAVGSSKLFGASFSTQPLQTTVSPATVAGATFQQVITQNTGTAATVQYVTAFQTAPSTTQAMDPTQQVVSSDGRMQGVQVANQVVLFGTAGSVNLFTPVTYQVSGAVQQLLTNVTAGGTFQVSVGGSVVGTFTASAQGTLSFATGGSGSQTVTVTELT